MSGAERFQNVQNLFHEAADLPQAERTAFLRERCPDDESLRQEVESLLAEDDRDSGFLHAGIDRERQPAFALPKGTRVGPYEIVAAIGAGGMGHVYRAHDTKLRRDVALKVLPEALASDPNRISRFQGEATFLAALNHPRIAAIYALEEINGRLALVMELVEGPTLAERIAAGPIPTEEALGIARQIGEALEAAHKRDIIHRDLKPGNIKLMPEGGIKVLDFGLGKLVKPDSSSGKPVSSPARTDPATEAGVILGTPSYMAPEQALGAAVDKRADIWAFGVVLYEMLTGQRPFAGETTSEKLSAVLTKDPDWERVPVKARPLLRRCLEKDPKLRPREISDAWDLVEDAPNKAPKRSRLPWITAAVACLLAVAVGFWIIRPGRPEAPPPAMQAVPVTADPGEEQHASFSPDGSQIVYAASDSLVADSDLYILALGTGAKLHLVPGPTFDAVPSWSPDGKWIAFWRREAGVCLISPLGGPVRRLGGDDTVYDIAWTPDSKHLAVANYGTPMETTMALNLIDIETGAITELLPPQAGLDQRVPNVLPSSISISADARFIARVEPAHDSHTHNEIVLYRLKGSAVTKYKTLRGVRPFIVGISFHADNRHLVAAMGSNSSNMHLYRVDIETSRTEPLPLDVPQALSPVTSRQGDKLIFTYQNYDENLYRLSLSQPGVVEGTPVPFATSTARDSNPNISSDGKRVAFGSYRTGAPEIYIADADGSNVQKLTTMNAAVGGSPRFSPDGKWLAFDSRPLSGEADVYLISTDGGPMRRLTSHPAADTVPTWSRDGAYIYFHSNRTGSEQVWKMKADGSNPVQITHGGGYLAFEGVDGKSIYYSKRDGVSTQLWRTGVNGGDEKLVVNTLYRHNFSPAASGIYLSTAKGLHGGPEILYYRFADGTLKTLYRLSRPVALGLTVARDESWLLFSQLDGTGSDLMMVEGFR